MPVNGKATLYVILKNDVFLISTTSCEQALVYQKQGYEVLDLSPFVQVNPKL